MRKVTVRLPATMTCIGPGIRALGLALGLYATIEISERADHQLIVDTAGEGAGHYSIGLRHPVALGLMRVFQQAERAPLGVHIRVNNQIPVASGLGAEAAFWVAGIIGGSNLLGLSLSRQDILKLSAKIVPQSDNAVGALLGGLSSAVQQSDELIYRSLPIQPFQVAIVTPDLDDYPETVTPPEMLPWQDAIHNVSRLPLLLEGFRTGDLSLISAMLDDRMLQPRLNARIPGYQHVRETARLAGAIGVTLSGTGPALIAFVPRNPQQVADAMIAAFGYAGIQARAQVAVVDTQGVVISAVQSS